MSNYYLEQIDIDNREFNYSTDDIFNILKNYIEYKEKIYDDDGVEVNLYYRLLIVCGFTGYLTDEKLLNHTLDVLRKFDLIDEIEEDFENKLCSPYSETDIIKIKAIYYSLTSLRKLNFKALKFPKSKNLVLLEINLKNRVIEHNLSEVLNSSQKNNVIQFKENISILPTNRQKDEINKWIRSALDVGYSKGTNMFEDDINHLEKISNHLIEPKTNQQTTPNSNKENIFSVLEWATIFYYADETKLLPDSKFSTTKREDFIKKHNIETTPSNFKNEYYNAKKRINIENNFPIEKLDLIIPFLKSKYSKAVDKVENDIVFLQNELLD